MSSIMSSTIFTNVNSIVEKEYKNNMYKYDGILYTSTFPREWAENHETDTGPKECLNCIEFGFWNGAFIGYCGNCAKYAYNGKRGKGLSFYGIETHVKIEGYESIYDGYFTPFLISNADFHDIKKKKKCKVKRRAYHMGLFL